MATNWRRLRLWLPIAGSLYLHAVLGLPVELVSDLYDIKVKDWDQNGWYRKVKLVPKASEHGAPPPIKMEINKPKKLLDLFDGFEPTDGNFDAASRADILSVIWRPYSDLRMKDLEHLRLFKTQGLRAEEDIVERIYQTLNPDGTGSRSFGLSPPSTGFLRILETETWLAAPELLKRYDRERDAWKILSESNFFRTAEHMAEEIGSRIVSFWVEVIYTGDGSSYYHNLNLRLVHCWLKSLKLCTGL